MCSGFQRAQPGFRLSPFRFVFHVELRQFPHVARAFNLTEEELRLRIVRAWSRNEIVELGERRWMPERARLTIYEGPRLRDDEIGMGRGWSNATRAGSDVTEQVLSTAQTNEGGGIASELAEFKREVIAHCATGRIGLHQVLWLANARYPERRLSERVALAEQSVWELLHERRLTMLRLRPGASAGEGPSAAIAGDCEPITSQHWQQTLLAWSSWADPRAPSVLLERVSVGRPD